MSKLAVTLTKSPIGNRPEARATVKALGLRRMHQTVYLPDNPSVRGMIFRVRHLVRWEEGGDGPPPAPIKRPSITVMQATAAGASTPTAVRAPDDVAAPVAAAAPTEPAEPDQVLTEPDQALAEPVAVVPAPAVEAGSSIPGGEEPAS